MKEPIRVNKRNWLFTIFAAITGILLAYAAAIVGLSAGTNVLIWGAAVLLALGAIISLLSAVSNKVEVFMLSLLPWWY